MNLRLTTDGLDPKVAHAIEELVSQINAVWAKEHNPDGSHGGRDGINVIDPTAATLNMFAPSQTAANGIKAGGVQRFTPYHCRVILDADQTIATATATLVVFGQPTTGSNTVGNFDIGSFLQSNPDDKLVIPADGTYMIVFESRWDSATPSLVGVRLGWLNITVPDSGLAAINIAAHQHDATTSPGTPFFANGIFQTVAMARLTKGSQIRAYVYQDSGGNLDLDQSSWIGALKVA